MTKAALRPSGKKPETLELPPRSETSTRVAKGQKATEEGIFTRNYKRARGSARF